MNNRYSYGYAEGGGEFKVDAPAGYHMATFGGFFTDHL